MAAEAAPEKIDLIAYCHRILQVLKRLWLPVLLLTALGAGGSCLWEKAVFQPVYEATAMLSIHSGNAGVDSFTISYAHGATNQLVNAFPQILRTDMMQDLLLAYLDTDQLNGTIHTAAVADTNLLQLSVTSPDPQTACDILQAVMACYPQVMVYYPDNFQMLLHQMPALPEAPVNSFSSTHALIKGGLIGCVLGLFTVLVMALLPGTVTDARELKRLVDLPLLAVIPHGNRGKHRNFKDTFLNFQYDPNLLEAIRGLRTRVRRQLADQGGKVVLLTSTLCAEGTSTVSANLALSLALEGWRVVLVDANLRSQSVYKLTGSRGRAGLLHCLKNSQTSVLECLTEVPGTGLSCLSGKNTTKKHFLIDSAAMNRVLTELKANFDYIVMDSPPCSLVSDTALLARFADCLLYVVKQDYTNALQIQDAVTALQEQDIHLTGCILNDVPRSRMNHGCGYGRKPYHSNDP